MTTARHVDDFFVESVLCEDDAKLRHVEDLVRRWLECEPHLPKNYDGAMVRSFVRGAKCQLEAAKRKLEGYFLAKHAFPAFYQDRAPGGKDVVEACEALNIVRLPRLTEKGERICVVALAKGADLDGFDMVAAIKLFWMLYDLTLTCTFPTSAEILVFDSGNVSARVFAQLLTPSFKSAVSLLRHAYAARVSQLHVVNCSATMERVFAVVRPLLHEKVKQRVTLHKHVESLRDYLQPEVLPADYGGKLGSLRGYMRQWTEILQKNAEWFQGQESVKIVGKPPKRISDFCSSVGVEGSFRQLNID